MISLETKTDATPSSPLGLSTPDKEPTLSFSELLSGAGKKDGKVIQNGALVLSLGADEKDVTKKTSLKSDALLSLLKNEDTKSIEIKEELTLNPKLTESLTPKELKALVSDAKQYLKSKILNSDEYKKSQLEELPKTLKGLATLAEKIGVDVSKISIQEIKIATQKIDKPLKTDNADKLESKKSVDTANVTKASKEVDDKEINHQTKRQDKKVDVKKYRMILQSQTPLFKAQRCERAYN